MHAIVTIPPYAPFIREVAEHPIVSGLRLNTVMPTKEPLDELLSRLKNEALGIDVWVDLKCRQLRVKNYCEPPFGAIELSHNITVETPTKAYFSDGKEYATVAAVEGNRLLMLDGPRRKLGPGESVNIPHSSLKIDGYLTETDCNYIAAAKKVGNQHIMLSYFEGEDDEKRVKELYPQSIIRKKIESRKGMNYVCDGRKKEGELMAARGDLYVELIAKPHHIIGAVHDIIKADPQAIVASRIFPSLANGYMPSAQDISDVDSLMRMRYRNFMFGDDICLRRESILSGLQLLMEMGREYRREQ